jgi:hypothetical protein
MSAPAEALGRPLLRVQVLAERRRGHLFYIGLTLVLMASVLAGFWSSYYSTLFGGGVERPMVMHVHGAVFTGWMALLLLQVGLAASGRVHAHRAVGRAGIAYGALVFVMGCIVTISAPVMHVRAGRWTLDAAASFLILPIGDMMLFAGLFGAAVFYRAKPEIHKRLIIAATVALAFAAVARLNYSLPVFFALWMAPMAAAMVFDLSSLGRVHRVNLLTTGVMAVAFLRLFLMETAGWKAVGRSILQPFL